MQFEITLVTACCKSSRSAEISICSGMLRLKSISPNSSCVSSTMFEHIHATSSITGWNGQLPDARLCRVEIFPNMREKI